MRIKRTQADALFSQYIRTRDKWKCRRCGKQYDEGSQGLHCAHIYSRRHWATRHHPANAVALCFACHQYTGGNPLEFARWCVEEFGQEAMDNLYGLSHSVAKKSKADEALRVVGLRAMLEGLCES